MKKTYWDVKVHTSDPDFSAIMVIEADNKADARNIAIGEIKTKRPDVHIRDLAVIKSSFKEIEDK
jgi:hypothetical protein